jgi:hypothetical protein
MQAAAALVMLAGSIAVASTVDGKKTTATEYGPALWVNTIPTSFGDNFPGAGGSVGNPGAVTSGVEVAIPYAAIGYSGTGPIKVCAFISGGGGFLSNQFIAPLPLNTANVGGGERNIDLTTIFGDQFVTVTPADATGILVDGTRDAAYGAIVSTQANYTGFGNANQGNIVQAFGSELDGLYVAKNDATQTLFLMFTGNLETNGNRLNIFLDTAAGGTQNIGQYTNGFIQTLGSDGVAPGFTFDAGFAPEAFISVNGNNSVPEGKIFVDYANLTLPLPGAEVYAGNSPFTTGLAGFDAPALIEGEVGAPAIRASIDNRNTAGVPGSPVALGNAAPNVDFAYGSEINAVYAKVDGPDLFILLTGNLETTFNKFHFFLDVAPGGQNRLRGASNLSRNYRGNTTGDFGALNRMGADALTVEEPAAPTNGLKFDADFAADYWISVTNGGVPVAHFSNASVLRTSGRRENTNGAPLDYASFDGGDKTGANANPLDYAGPRGGSGELAIDNPGFDPGQPEGPLNPRLLFLDGEKFTNFAPRLNADRMVDPVAANRVELSGLVNAVIDNSNVKGVTSAGVGTGPDSPANVATGVEIRISLTEAGWDGTSPIKILAFLTNGGNDFISNQMVGLDLTANGSAQLGDPRNLDLSTIAGNQFVTLSTGPVACGPSDIASPGPVAGADGELTADDIIFFISAFTANNLAVADIAGPGPVAGADGELTADDIILFITRFTAGCP